MGRFPLARSHAPVLTRFRTSLPDSLLLWKAESFLGLLQLACAQILLRRFCVLAAHAEQLTYQRHCFAAGSRAAMNAADFATAVSPSGTKSAWNTCHMPS